MRKSKPVSFVAICVAALLAAAVLIIMTRPSATPQKSWTYFDSISGYAVTTSGFQSSVFTISNPWRVTWDASYEHFVGGIAIYADFPLGWKAVDFSNQTSGIMNENLTGDFYIEVMNGLSWNITIEQWS